MVGTVIISLLSPLILSQSIAKTNVKMSRKKYFSLYVIGRLDFCHAIVQPTTERREKRPALDLF